MTSTSETASRSPKTTTATAPSRTSAASQPLTSSGLVNHGFQVYWGRLVLAVTGLCALLALPVLLLLSAFGAVSWWLALTAAALVVGSAVSLRFLAVRERAARSITVSVTKTLPTEPSVPQQCTSTLRKTGASAEVFDAQLGYKQQGRQQTSVEGKLFTAEELRQAALAVAQAAEQKTLEQKPCEQKDSEQKRETATEGQDGDSWQPVKLPKPSYVDAARAQRPAPVPLELPEEPKPSTKTSIKADQVPRSKPIVAVAPVVRASAAKRTAQNNLDDVLQRRRA